MTRCIGSSKYSVCHHGLATEGLWSSCLSLLFFGNLVQAMKISDLKPYPLPVSERAVNLKFGIWLILLASSDFELRESDLNGTTHLSTKVYPGCRICILILACGRQIRGPNVFIRSDLQTCSTIPPSRFICIFQHHWPTSLVHFLPCVICLHLTPYQQQIWIFSVQ